MIKKIPYLLALLGILGGTFIAIMFGVNEKYFKNKIARDLRTSQVVTRNINPSQLDKFYDKEESKNWRYYQRFHFHSSAIAALSLGLLLLLGRIKAPVKLKLISSYMISAGGFLYPFVWLFAAIYGPVIGRGAAKEQFAVFGYMGGVFFMGVVFACFLLMKYSLKEET